MSCRIITGEDSSSSDEEERGTVDVDDQILAAFAPLEDCEVDDGRGGGQVIDCNPLKRGLGGGIPSSSEDANRSLPVANMSMGSMNKKSRSSDITNVTSNVVWTQKMDELLKDAVMKYQDNWMVISEAVRTQLTMLSLDASFSSSVGNSAAQIPVEVSPPLPVHPDPMECMERWNQLQYEKVPTWTEHEIATLQRLVTAQQEQKDRESRSGSASSSSSGSTAIGEKEARINWSVIAMDLGRKQSDVLRQWNAIKVASMKHGPFTQEEDLCIIHAVQNWRKNNLKAGIWVHLEKQMNRKDKRISERWRHVLSKKYANIDGVMQVDSNYSNVEDPYSALKAAEKDTPYKDIIRWSEEMDQRLREGVSTYNKDWNQIALHVGISANSSKCRKRWARLQDKVRRSQDEDLILPDSFEAAD